jgi:hypothetical protein
MVSRLSPRITIEKANGSALNLEGGLRGLTSSYAWKSGQNFVPKGMIFIGSIATVSVMRRRVLQKDYA